jgi:tetratricopeptide (TPR) repeat protein
MKYIIVIIFILISFLSFGQQMTYVEWKIEAQKNIRLQPKYGNVQKTDGQKKADKDLIADYLAQAGTHYKASELLIKLGFDYLYKGDLKTAMYRFNQAWLLDPTNENVFWGFGAVYFTFQDFKTALKQYNDGLTLNPKSSNILTDKASVYMANYNIDQNAKDLDNAINLFKSSLDIDNKNQNTLFKISSCYYFKKDCKNALLYYNKCMKLGGKPVTQEYTDAIRQLCKT